MEELESCDCFEEGNRKELLYQIFVLQDRRRRWV